MKQIQIIVPNRTGVLDEVLEVLAHAHINVESVDVESMGSNGVIALMVDHYEDAFKLLSHAGYSAVSEDVLVLTVPDKPGALGKISHQLHEANIGIRSLRILSRSEGHTTVGLVCEDHDAASKLLHDALAVAR
ncbi:MAG: ACT domain-containing protein [Alphaproteobacteria bacterium]|nr:MAG: ACT domain-containing protein [Alphaproteobacteria bacterium]TAF15120.1 MAG: ACT domain-containing protein [Alphaproteobacteria bacterium]TAF76693.1 MAG: ACT domain-containing protein [Alphaproteobacteria bacterium]